MGEASPDLNHRKTSLGTKECRQRIHSLGISAPTQKGLMEKRLTPPNTIAITYLLMAFQWLLLNAEHLRPPDAAQILTFWQHFFVLHKSSYFHKQMELPKAPVNKHSLADVMMGPRMRGFREATGRLTHLLRSQQAQRRRQTQTDLHVDVSQNKGDRGGEIGMEVF